MSYVIKQAELKIYREKRRVERLEEKELSEKYDCDAPTLRKIFEREVYNENISILLSFEKWIIEREGV